MNSEEKVRELASIWDMCSTEDELLDVFVKKEKPIAIDRFEPSGRMHVAQVSL